MCTKLTRGYHTEVDVGLASGGAGNGGHGGDRAALLEGDEVVEVVEIGEHLDKIQQKISTKMSSSIWLQQNSHIHQNVSTRQSKCATSFANLNDY